jgi:hypothetical protein
MDVKARARTARAALMAPWIGSERTHIVTESPSQTHRLERAIGDAPQK